MNYERWKSLKRLVTIEVLVIDMHDRMMHPGEEARIVASELVDKMAGKDENLVTHTLEIEHTVGSALIALDDLGLLSEIATGVKP